MSIYLKLISPETLNALASLEVSQREVVLRVADIILKCRLRSLKQTNVDSICSEVNTVLCGLVNGVIEGRRREETRAVADTQENREFWAKMEMELAAYERAIDPGAAIPENQGSLAGKRGE